MVGKVRAYAALDAAVESLSIARCQLVAICRALAQDALTEAVSILTNKRASLDGEYSSDDRNEAALIASRMPIIIAQTYAEL